MTIAFDLADLVYAAIGLYALTGLCLGVTSSSGDDAPVWFRFLWVVVVTLAWPVFGLAGVLMVLVESCLEPRPRLHENTDPDFWDGDVTL